MTDEKLEYGPPEPCPCGQSDKYCPIKNAGMNGGGKCHSTKCGQRFFPPERANGHPSLQRGSQFREHTYTDENDYPLSKVTIWKTPTGEKRTSISHWANDQWQPKLNQTRRVPYNLSRVLDAISLGRYVLIVEGEKDCDNATALDLDATTAMFGAGKWNDGYSNILHGIKSVIIADNDEAGRKHAQQVEESLRRTNAAQLIIQLDLTRLMPGLPVKGDLSDYFDLGGSVQALNDEIQRLIDIESADSVVEDEPGIITPSINTSNLSPLLRDLLDTVDDENHRVALFLSVIVAIGSVMPTVSAFYSQTLSAMMYLFIVGEAGSGKSITLAARGLVAGIEDIHRDHNRVQEELYQLALRQWESQPAKDRDVAPTPPDYKTLLLSPDSTSPVIIRALAVNDSLLIHATEADALRTALSPKNGDASAAFRSAWHHEPISQNRITGNLRVHCDRPNLAMILSGTPEQILPLVQGSENGLASRFAFMQLRTRRKFVNQFDRASRKTDEMAKLYAPTVTAFYRHLLDRHPTVLFSDLQQSTFVELFKDAYESNIEDIDDAVTLRSATITVRICMVLAALRYFEEKGCIPPEIFVSDLDFETALSLGIYLRLSSGDIVERLKSLRPASFPKRQPTRALLLHGKLPASFTTADAIQLGKHLSIPAVAVNRYLAIAKLFTRTAHGHYLKMDPMGA